MEQQTPEPANWEARPIVAGMIWAISCFFAGVMIYIVHAPWRYAFLAAPLVTTPATALTLYRTVKRPDPRAPRRT
jgi:hypothetical protein